MSSSLKSAAPDCGCAEQRGLSRRTFLRASLATLAGIAGGGLLDLGGAQVALAEAGYTGDVLVVVSLRGGFDGLSAVVPAGDPGYAAARPGIAVPTSKLIAAGGMFGLHPALKPLEPLWRAGTFGAVHAVGQKDPTRSHFAAMEELERAAPGSSLRTGWIDRMVGASGATSTFAATSLGSTTTTTAFAGPQPELSLRNLPGFSLAGAGNETARWKAALAELHTSGPEAVVAAARRSLSALDTAAALPGASPLPEGVSYPEGSFGEALRDVARLIRGGVGARVAAVDLGGWDMHEGVGGVDGGWMARQLDQLARGLAAFAADLGEAFSRTTVVTLSEFGRRVQENGSGGLDHGNGNAVLLLGGGVAGGRVHGRWPGLSAGSLVEGDLAGTTDYRTLLAEILEARCGVPARTVFPGLAPARLGVVRAR
ncbi:DUF1501 domain-containing protein [Motilibacter aurantiacus]|uniref:DUF1501 domain-containing protein n=1 Tax=Motilibacter aurantiacus TaxID=2714955 RepID=UPI00140C7B3E|nr:DUF1501 domain-containing protein [Motilibacter aurantiacus]NHC46395.1 DUF1501 domain-containing protein [Motilibacter aurantiacus]